jgi:hypothetical protein
LWGLSLPLAWLPLPRLGADQRDNAPYCENSVGTGSIFVEMILFRCQEDDTRVPGVDELVPRDVRGFEKAGRRVQDCGGVFVAIVGIDCRRLQFEG